jgi:hypothetical protein
MKNKAIVKQVVEAFLEADVEKALLYMMVMGSLNCL